MPPMIVGIAKGASGSVWARENVGGHNQQCAHGWRGGRTWVRLERTAELVRSQKITSAPSAAILPQGHLLFERADDFSASRAFLVLSWLKPFSAEDFRDLLAFPLDAGCPHISCACCVLVSCTPVISGDSPFQHSFFVCPDSLSKAR